MCASISSRSSPRGILPVESDGIPGDELKDVANTSFDFRQPKTIAADFLADADPAKGEGIRSCLPAGCQRRRQPACGTGLVAGWQAADDGLYLPLRRCSFTPATISAAPRRRRRSPTPTGRGWRWRANSCRIRRTIRNGRSRTVYYVRARSTSA